MTGNKPNFTNIDVLRCFLRLSKNTGRQELSRQLKLGEGTVRTILGLLKSRKLLQSTKKGHFLSKLGLLELSRLHDNVENPNCVIDCLATTLTDGTARFEFANPAILKVYVNGTQEGYVELEVGEQVEKIITYP